MNIKDFTITEKVVTRYELVCNTCGRLIGEFADNDSTLEAAEQHYLFPDLDHASIEVDRALKR